MSRLHLLNILIALFLIMLPAQPTQAAPSQADAGNSRPETESFSALLDDPAPTVTAISSGSYHTCELWSDGKISCWGAYTTYDQLVVPTPNENWVQVSAGHTFSCARKNDDTLQCWGYNGNGEATPTVTSDVMHVSTGAAHACATLSDDTLYCWGYHDAGQQTTVPTPNEGWEQEKFSAGGFHTCGVKTDGTLLCWGTNTYGQTAVPTPNSGWTQVDGGGEHTCGFRSGTLLCWGAGTTDTGSNPNYGQSIVPSGTFTQVSAGNLHTCGLKSDNTIQCWGYNGSGQTNVPTPNADWAQVSAGDRHTCGLKTDGTVRCWGYPPEAPVVYANPSYLPSGRIGAAYTTPLTGSGGTSPYTFSIVSGSVPGLTLNTDGTWSGTPTTAGTYDFTAQANDANNIAGRRDYTLTIDDTPPTVASIQRGIPADSTTAANIVKFAVGFSESVTDVSNADFTLTTDIADASITNTTVNGSYAAYLVTVNTGTGDGTIRLDVPATGVTITDMAGNPLGGLPYTGGQTYTIDKSLAFTSTGSRDGWVLESSETSGVGGSISASSTTLRVGDDAAKKQYRSILSFSTGASLPDTAAITKVTLKVRKQGITGGGNPITTFQGFMVDIKKGYFGTSSLQTADFQTAASKTYGPFKPALSSSWYSIDLTSGKNYINKVSSYSGLTQIRLRFKLDDNNNAVANYLSLYSGNVSAASRPQLIIEYYVP